MGLVELMIWDETGLATAHRATPCPRRRNKTCLVAPLFQIHVESLPFLDWNEKRREPASLPFAWWYATSHFDPFGINMFVEMYN